MDVNGTITMDNVAAPPFAEWSIYVMYNCRAAASICVIDVGCGDLVL